MAAGGRAAIASESTSNPFTGLSTCPPSGNDPCRYTDLSSSMHPTLVMKLLSRLYSKMDALAVKHGVWKVETVRRRPDGCSVLRGAEMNETRCLMRRLGTHMSR